MSYADPIPSLLELSERALVETHDRHRTFDSLPPHSAARVISSLHDRGDLTLRSLLKFASVPLDSLDLTGCCVTDEWMPLVASFPLSELDLSLNPMVTDDGLASLIGLRNAIRSSKKAPRRKQDPGTSPPISKCADDPSPSPPQSSALHRSKSDFSLSKTPQPEAKATRRSNSDEAMQRADLAHAGRGPPRGSRTTPQERGPLSVASPTNSGISGAASWAAGRGAARCDGDDSDCRPGQPGRSASAPSPGASPSASPLGGSSGGAAPGAWPPGRFVVLGPATRSVRALVLTGTAVTNAGLAHLAGLPLLARLELCRTERVGNPGVQARRRAARGAAPAGRAAAGQRGAGGGVGRRCGWPIGG